MGVCVGVWVGVCGCGCCGGLEVGGGSIAADGGGRHGRWGWGEKVAPCAAKVSATDEPRTLTDTRANPIGHCAYLLAVESEWYWNTRQVLEVEGGVTSTAMIKLSPPDKLHVLPLCWRPG